MLLREFTTYPTILRENSISDKPWKYDIFSGASQVDDSLAAHLKQKYLSQKITLLGMDETEAAWQESFPINQIYTNLVLTNKDTKAKQKHSSLEKLGFVENLAMHSSINLEEIFDREELKDKDKKVVVIFGVAGSGKSTLCKHITYQWSRTSLWNHFKLVFYITLKNLNAKNHPNIRNASIYQILADEHDRTTKN